MTLMCNADICIIKQNFIFMRNLIIFLIAFIIVASSCAVNNDIGKVGVACERKPK
jgi:hypothetical protein